MGCENANCLRETPGYYGFSRVLSLTSATPSVSRLTKFGTGNSPRVMEDLLVQPHPNPVGDARQRSVHPTLVRLNRSLWSVRPLAKAADPVEKFTQLPGMEPHPS